MDVRYCLRTFSVRVVGVRDGEMGTRTGWAGHGGYRNGSVDVDAVEMVCQVARFGLTPFQDRLSWIIAA